jgi:hypothetical protein
LVTVYGFEIAQRKGSLSERWHDDYEMGRDIEDALALLAILQAR